MSRTISNVFDEKFLLNFTLGSLPISVADMLLVDYILADKESWNNTDSEVLERADRNIGITDSPEATRHQAEVDDDRVLICSQRCRSPIQCENASHSTEKLGAPGNNFSVLSPILREVFDVSIFDQDQHCDLGTTFNLFGSPDEYGSTRTGAITGNQNTSDSSNRMSLNQSGSCSPDHMSVDIMDPFDLNINKFSRLSLDPTDSDRRKKVKEKDKNTEKGEVLDLIADKHSRTFQNKKSTKMKQTTVTFFYDSDDEINENSDFDLDDQSAANNPRESKLKSRSSAGLNGRSKGMSKKCGYGARSTHSLAPSLPLALAPRLEMKIKMKNKSSMLAGNSTHSSSANCFDMPSSTSTATTTSSSTAAKTAVNPHLQRWMINVRSTSVLYD